MRRYSTRSETRHSHNQTCRGRVLIRVREDDTQRTQGYDEKHIRRAVERNDAQTQSQMPADGATDPTADDMQTSGERVTQTRPRESDVAQQGGAMSPDDRPSTRLTSPTRPS